MSLHDYSNMRVHPEVANSIFGNVNGQVAAQQMWKLLNEDEEASKDRDLIADKVNKITDGKINTCPSGVCVYSEKYRLLMLNEDREEWVRAGSHRMFTIGNYLTKQSIKYRYIKGAAPDGGTIIIIALPLRKDQIAVMDGQGIEDRIARSVDDIIQENKQETQTNEPPITTSPKRVVRNIRRKKQEEVEIEVNEED